MVDLLQSIALIILSIVQLLQALRIRDHWKDTVKNSESILKTSQAAISLTERVRRLEREWFND